MADENQYGECECRASGCEAVFMDADLRDRHYRRVHKDNSTPREHAPPLSREELVNPDEDGEDGYWLN